MVLLPAIVHARRRFSVVAQRHHSGKPWAAQFSVGLDSQTLAAFGAASVDDSTTAAGFHANQKTVGSCAARFRRLVSAFHGISQNWWEKPLIIPNFFSFLPRHPAIGILLMPSTKKRSFLPVFNACHVPNGMWINF
jgi:hypothetical protein